MTRKAVRLSRLSKRILSSAVSVVMAVYRGISTVRNVLKDEANTLIGNDNAATTEKALQKRHIEISHPVILLDGEAADLL
jgi:hypothetical protein